uniref:Uncharacterized protein n=1 Tax=Lepeophtheirus salmonis TaxID=72036 RepID=A0A0K2TBX0_LEPSM
MFDFWNLMVDNCDLCPYQDT